MKVSNKLTNALIVDINKGDEKLFKTNLGKLGIQIVNVSFPDKLENISEKFIEKNWKNVSKYNKSNTVFVR